MEVLIEYIQNKVTIDKTVKDKWGLNVLNIDCELKENEIKMRKDIFADAQEMLEKAGVKNPAAAIGMAITLYANAQKRFCWMVR